MGNKCCTERKDAPRPGSSAPRAAENGATGARGQERKSLAQGNAYGKRAISIGYSSKGDDAEKFDKAFETNDLKVFVELLSSNQPIESFEERMHPWAEDPKTVGALAGTQLAILASMAEKDKPRAKDEIRKAGAIKPLVEFLQSKEKDRVQTAVVALSFLTTDCSANTKATYEAGAMESLMEHIESPVAGMRAAAATTLRNICMASLEYRKAFVAAGGIKGLVTQLDPEEDPTLNHADVQLEAVLNLQDILEEDDGENEPQMIEEYALEAIKLGAIDKLTSLLKVDDGEVRSSAQEVLDGLKHVRR
jgi:hypothetical protein